MDELISPMLAKPYRAELTKFPAYVQPKFNGIRCLWDGERAWTRNLKDHKPHIRELLAEHCPVLPDMWVLDGELLLPREYDFQTTCSAVKKAQDLSVMLTYVVFDRYDRGHTQQPFWARQDNLSNWYPGLVGPIKMKVVLASTYRVDAPENVEHWHGIWKCAGYEGVMIRDANAPYVQGSSGRSLQKYKKFLDEEFPIVEIKEGEGKDKGTAIFVCKVPSTGETFAVRPKGSLAVRRKYWEDRHELLGKMLTVQYQEKFKSGTPQFPIGIAVRDYE